MADLPNRILEHRLAAGLSQQALGDAIGVSKMSISAMERGIRSLKLDKLQALAAALGVNVPDLLHLDDNPLSLSAEEVQWVMHFRDADEVTRRNLTRVAEALTGYTAQPVKAA